MRRSFFPALSTLAAVLTAVAPASADTDTKAACVEAANTANVQRQAEPTKLLDLKKKLLACAAEECPSAVRDECREQLAALERDLPSVVLVAEDERGQALLDVRVDVDGRSTVERLDGRPMDIDPGAHDFVFQREGAAPVRVSIIARVGQKGAAVTARFEGPRESATPPVDSVVAPEPSSRPPRPLATVGLVVGAAGVVALGVGAYFGARAISKKSDADCPGNVCSSTEKADVHAEAQSAADLSTGFVIAGSLLVVGGLSLFFLAPTSRPASSAKRGLVPLLGPGGAGLSFHGDLL